MPEKPHKKGKTNKKTIKTLVFPHGAPV